MSIEKELAKEKGWKFLDKDGKKFVIVKGEKLRYYEYPPEEYNLDVRLMILSNTAAELEVILDPRDNIGQNLSITRLERIKKALKQRLDAIPEQSGDKPEYKHYFQALCRNLCCVNFKLGAALIKDVLTQAKEGKSIELLLPTIQQAFFDCIDQAPHFGMMGEIAVAGNKSSANYKTLQRLSHNLKMIADYETPVKELITHWYDKIADIMIQMRNHLKMESDLFGKISMEKRGEKFFAACCDLLQARRNEPEYALALVEANAQLEAAKEVTNQKNSNVASSPRTKKALAAYDAIYRAAITREPVAGQPYPIPLVDRM